MKMLLLIYRNGLDQDIRRLLKGLAIREIGEAPKVFGIGEAGQSAHTPAWPGTNCMIFAEMSDDQAEAVIKELQAFRDHLSDLQGGAKVPLRVLVLPCERVI